MTSAKYLHLCHRRRENPSWSQVLPTLKNETESVTIPEAGVSGYLRVLSHLSIKLANMNILDNMMLARI